MIALISLRLVLTAAVSARSPLYGYVGGGDHSCSRLFVSSTALEAEISKTPDLSRRQRVMDSLIIAKLIIPVTKKILQRAREITSLGFKSFDALHISCAEAAKADILLTTDDRLLRNVQRHESNLDVRVSNPVIWLMEISKAGDD
jgi:predicted nucleic acid-binding protein